MNISILKFRRMDVLTKKANRMNFPVKFIQTGRLKDIKDICFLELSSRLSCTQFKKIILSIFFCDSTVRFKAREFLRELMDCAASDKYQCIANHIRQQTTTIERQTI